METLSKVHVGTNGDLVKLPRQKSKAIERCRKTIEAIAFYTAQEEKAKRERKNLEREFKKTKPGLKIEELKALEKEGKACRRELGSRYMGMLEAFKELELNIDPEQIKQIMCQNGSAGRGR